MKKRCADCKQYKLTTEFPRNKNTKDGLHCYCKECNNARSRESWSAFTVAAVTTT